jgi:hypothetical protein
MQGAICHPVSRKKIRRIRGIAAHWRRIARESTFPQRGMRIYEEDRGEKVNVWIDWAFIEAFWKGIWDHDSDVRMIRTGILDECIIITTSKGNRRYLAVNLLYTTVRP